MKTVQIDVQIPDGYDLDDGKQPRHLLGTDDHYLIPGEDKVQQVKVPENCPKHLHVTTSRPVYILVKSWEPQMDKVYMASNEARGVGTCRGFLINFQGMDEGLYVDQHFKLWTYCWPLPKDMIGE